MQAAVSRLWSLVCVAGLVVGSDVDAQERPPRMPEPVPAVNVFNPVEGRITVLSSKPDGMHVKKGDVICELDPSPLKDRLAVEDILVRSAEAELNAARMAREVAEIALNEYTEGTYKHELQTYLGEQTLTDADRKRAEDQLEWSNQMLEKGYVSLGRNLADKISLRKAMFAFEAASTKISVLEKFTKTKTVTQRRAELERARATELEKQAGYERHRAARANLSRQVGLCRVTAPTGGRVHYNRPMGAGAVIQDGEVLFQVVPEPQVPTGR